MKNKTTVASTAAKAPLRNAMSDDDDLRLVATMAATLKSGSSDLTAGEAARDAVDLI